MLQMDGPHDYSRKHAYDMWGAAVRYRTAVEFLYKSVERKDSDYQLTKPNAMYITHTSFAGLVDQIKCKYDSKLWDVESASVISDRDRDVEALSESSLNKILGHDSFGPYEGKRVQITLRRKADAVGFAAFDREDAERLRKKMEHDARGRRAAERFHRRFNDELNSASLGNPNNLNAMLSLHNRLSRLESELGCDKP